MVCRRCWFDWSEWGKLMLVLQKAELVFAEWCHFITIDMCHDLTWNYHQVEKSRHSICRLKAVLKLTALNKWRRGLTCIISSIWDPKSQLTHKTLSWMWVNELWVSELSIFSIFHCCYGSTAIWPWSQVPCFVAFPAFPDISFGIHLALLIPLSPWVILKVVTKNPGLNGFAGPDPASGDFIYLFIFLFNFFFFLLLGPENTTWLVGWLNALEISQGPPFLTWAFCWC